MNDLATTSPFLTLPMVIQALRGSLGAWSWRGWLNEAVARLVHWRLGEICGRLERLAVRFQAVRFQAGRLRTAGTRKVAVRAVGAEAERTKRDEAARILPRQFGWLVQAGSYHAAGFGAQLRVILAHPDMVALLLAAPQAARLLRPVCRMLAVETSLLRPRPAGEANAAVAVPAEAEAPEAAEAPVAAKRVRKPRAPVDWGRIPLPRGVLSAARRDRALKG